MSCSINADDCCRFPTTLREVPVRRTSSAHLMTHLPERDRAAGARHLGLQDQGGARQLNGFVNGAAMTIAVGGKGHCLCCMGRRVRDPPLRLSTSQQPRRRSHRHRLRCTCGWRQASASLPWIKIKLHGLSILRPVLCLLAVSSVLCVVLLAGQDRQIPPSMMSVKAPPAAGLMVCVVQACPRACPRGGTGGVAAGVWAGRRRTVWNRRRRIQPAVVHLLLIS
jgi:hypothetical protein